jgi:hypothetical protein
VPANKRLIEIAVMPIVITALGIFGTCAVTSQQNTNAVLMAQTQLQSEETRSRSEQQIKILEIFSNRISSPNVDERQLAIRILSVLDGDLASKLATAVSANEKEDPSVRTLAREVAASQASKGYSFPVIASYSTLAPAIATAVRIGKEYTTIYPTEVYRSENGYFAVTLGGYLSPDEASKRSEYARNQGIAGDAYVRTSKLWGQRLN